MTTVTTIFQIVRDVSISPLSVSLALVTVLLSVGFWIWLNKPKNLPPGPWFVHPGSKPHEVLTDVSKKFGPVYSLTIGPTTTVVVLNDLESFREVFVKQGNLALNRNLPPLMVLVAPPEGRYTSAEGETWRQLRKFGVMAMRQFGNDQKILIQRINEEARILCDYFEKYNGQPFNQTLEAGIAFSNIMNMMMFGTRYEYNDVEFNKMMDHFAAAANLIKITDIANFFPFLYWTPLYKEHRGHMKDVHKFLGDIIEEHKQSYQPNEIRDIVDLYLSECQKEGNGMLPHDDTVIWAGIFDLLGAATQTSNVSMDWILLYLAKYQDVQKKVQKQIDAVVGSGRQPTLQDRDNLPWLMAAITEAYRIRPSSPFTQRGTVAEIQVNGFTIPKGGTIIGNMWAILHDPITYPNPDVYDPTRFLTAEGKYNPYNVWEVAFGFGQRNCIGSSLAKTELYLFTANLLQRFNIALPEDQQNPDMSGYLGLLVAAKPHNLCWTPR